MATATAATIVGDAAGTQDILTAEALALVAEMERAHGPARLQLLARRIERAERFRQGERPALLAETADVRSGDWQVRPAPADLADRRCEITGPAERKMMIGAFNCGARVFMCDIEDALSPGWANVIDAQRNIRDAADLTLTFERPDGSVDRLNDHIATPVIRPRGLHMNERRVLVDGAQPSASVFDATLLALHSAARFQARGSSLYLYLPKIESHHEAAWWTTVLGDLEARLGLEHGSIRVTVLIETILAAYEMEEILHALRDRITALNAGRWDYIFSVIKKFGFDPRYSLPDRSQVTMTVPFMATYARRLVAICHRRGAHAIGGMSAFIPNRRNPEVTDRALAAVRTDKEREAGLGYDGTWVAHPDLVPVATEQFDKVLGTRPNQLEVQATGRVRRFGSARHGDSRWLRVTARACTTTSRVALQYLEAWLAGRGAVAINDLMEDAATAEISRSQLWQWIRHGQALEDSTLVTAELVERGTGRRGGPPRRRRTRPRPPGDRRQPGPPSRPSRRTPRLPHPRRRVPPHLTPPAPTPGARAGPTDRGTGSESATHGHGRQCETVAWPANPPQRCPSGTPTPTSASRRRCGRSTPTPPIGTWCSRYANGPTGQRPGGATARTRAPTSPPPASPVPTAAPT